MKKKLKNGFLPAKGTDAARVARVVGELQNLLPISRKERRQRTIALVTRPTLSVMLKGTLNQPDVNENSEFESGGDRKPKEASLNEPSGESKQPASRRNQDESSRSAKQTQDFIRKRFKQNEKIIVPILEDLHAVDDCTKSTEIYRLLKALDGNVANMRWRFIELHKVPYALKPARNVLKSRGKSFAIISELRDKMKAQYDKDKEEFPHVYTPKGLCDASYLENSEKTKRCLEMRLSMVVRNHRPNYP